MSNFKENDAGVAEPRSLCQLYEQVPSFEAVY